MPFRNVFVQKHQNKVILAIGLLISRTFSGFESLSGLYDLKRQDNIIGINDLNSLFGLEKSKATFWVISMPSGPSAASMTSTASMTSVASTASFNQNTY